MAAFWPVSRSVPTFFHPSLVMASGPSFPSPTLIALTASTTLKYCGGSRQKSNTKSPHQRGRDGPGKIRVRCIINQKLWGVMRMIIFPSFLIYSLFFFSLGQPFQASQMMTSEASSSLYYDQSSTAATTTDSNRNSHLAVATSAYATPYDLHNTAGITSNSYSATSTAPVSICSTIRRELNL